jgi:hypothetical protein
MLPLFLDSSKADLCCPAPQAGPQPQSSHGMTNMLLLSSLPMQLNHPSTAAYSAAYSPLIHPTY